MAKHQLVAKVGIKREDGWLYYVDKDGDISRSKMVHNKKTAKQRKK